MGKLLSLTQRAHPSQPINWALYGLEPGQMTASGIKINEETAQGITAVYACLRVLSETVSSLPVHLFRRISDDKRERATKHPLYRLINKKPNPEMASMIFREVMMLHLNSWGNFYGNIVWNQGGQVAAIWPLRPDRMRPERIENEIKYIYTLDNGEQRLMNKSDVLHVPGLGFDGLVGYSPIAKNREAIALAKAAEEFGARFFANDARPGIVLKHPGELGEAAQNRLRKNWEKMHTGLENKHRLAILEEGMGIETIGIPPQEAQWIELRNMQLTEVARIYRIPPPLLGDLSHATFSNVEELTRHFAIHTIRPWLSRIEQVMMLALLGEAEQDEYYIEHLMDALMRADIAARYSSYATGRQWGWLSANDVRRMENMDVLEDGDIYLTPANMFPAGEIPEKTPEPDAKKPKLIVKPARSDTLQESFRPLFDSCFAKILNREYVVLDRLVKKNDSASIEQALDELYAKDGKFCEFVRDMYKPALDAYVSSIEAAAGIETEEYFQDFLDQYICFSRHQISDVIMQNPKNVIDALLKRIDTWSEKRALALTGEQLEKAIEAFTGS